MPLHPVGAPDMGAGRRAPRGAQRGSWLPVLLDTDLTPLRPLRITSFTLVPLFPGRAGGIIPILSDLSQMLCKPGWKQGHFQPLRLQNQHGPQATLTPVKVTLSCSP